ncbi:MAG: hypothetical protein IJF87_03205 [Erysipelotrichaceae bacterium]|nr:hypothetical protein [Erysipelotrichaceae bacterium]
MNKYERTTSYRFSKDTYQKLDMIYEDEKRKTDRMKLKAKGRNQIVEEAIRDRYFKMVNDSQDADIVERISGLVTDQVNAAMGVIQQRIDELLFLAIKNDLGNRVLYRSPSVLPAPKDKEQAMRVIMNETSMWDLALEDYLMDQWARKKILIHVRQEED